MDGQFVVTSSIGAASVLVAMVAPAVGYFYRRHAERRENAAAAVARTAVAVPESLDRTVAGGAVQLRMVDALLSSGKSPSGEPQLTISVTFGPEAPAAATPVVPDRLPPEHPPATVPPSTTPQGPAAPATMTELRVAGVPGTPAEVILDEPIVRRVSGDMDGRFYRPGAGRLQTDHAGAWLEAYRWLRFTSAAASRGMWMLLLPFLLVNLLPWLRPPMASPRRWLHPLCRVLALAMTATFVLAVAGLSMNLLAWQCVGDAGCVGRHRLLASLTRGVLAGPGPRLAVAALAPLLALGVLWFIGRRTWARYESYPAASSAVDGDGLADPLFWNGRSLLARLRSLHVATGLASVDAILVGAAARFGHPAVGHLLLVAAIVVLASCALLTCLPAVTSRDTPSYWAASLCRGVRTVAVLLTAGSLGYAAMVPGRAVTAGALPGFATVLDWLVGGQVVVLLALTVVIVSARPRPGGPLLLGGLAAPIAGSVAVGIAVSFAAALHFQVAVFLGLTQAPGAAPDPVAPLIYRWAAFGFAIVLAIVALAALVTRTAILPSLRRRARVVTDADFVGDRARDPSRARRIDEAVAEAQLTDSMPRLLAAAYLPAAAGATTAVALALAGIAPQDAAPAGSDSARVLTTIADIGRYAISFTALGLLLLGILAYRFPWTRRTIGIVWDAATFWPRRAHPFAPPCYAERIVGELATRSAWLASNGGVVLAATGPGSVLATAAVLQLPPPAAAHTAMVTVGSPLRRVYGRLFPAYVHDQLFETLAARLKQPDGGVRWRNLWRATDPIGGPVGVPQVDVRVRDPLAFGRLPGDTTFQRINADAPYWPEPAYTAAVDSLVSALSPAQPDVGGRPESSA